MTAVQTEILDKISSMTVLELSELIKAMEDNSACPPLPPRPWPPPPPPRRPPPPKSRPSSPSCSPRSARNKVNVIKACAS